MYYKFIFQENDYYAVTRGSGGHAVKNAQIKRLDSNNGCTSDMSKMHQPFSSAEGNLSRSISHSFLPPSPMDSPQISRHQNMLLDTQISRNSSKYALISRRSVANAFNILCHQQDFYFLDPLLVLQEKAHKSVN